MTVTVRERSASVWVEWVVPVFLISVGMWIAARTGSLWWGVGGADLVPDYVSSKAILDGLDPYSSQAELRARYGFGGVDPRSPVYFNPHFPVAILTTLPFAFLPFPVALAFYQAGQIVSMAAAWWWAVRLWWRPGFIPLMIGCLIGAWAPFWQGLDWGAPPGFLPLAVLTAWRLSELERPWGAGFFAAIAAGIRLPGVGVTVGWAKWDRSKLGRAVLTGGLTWLAALAVVGASPLAWIKSASSVEHFIESGTSLSSALGLGTIGAGLVAAAGLGLAWMVGARLADQDSGAALGLCLAMATFPLGWFHYDTTLLLVVIWVVGRSETPLARLPALLFFLLAGIPTLQNPGSIYPALRILGRFVLASGVVAVTMAQPRSTSLRNLPV